MTTAEFSPLEAHFPLDAISDVVASNRRLGKLLLGGIGPGVAAAGLLLDGQVGRRVWARTEPHITDYPTTDSDGGGVGIIAVGGFNSHPKSNTNALLPVLSSFGPVAYLNDSHGCLDHEKNTKVVHQWCIKKGVTAPVLLGYSQGTMINLPIAANLQDEGLEPIILMDSSPYSFADVKGSRGRMLELLAGLHERGWYGGPVARFMLETVGAKLETPGIRGFFSAVAHAIEKARAEDTPSNPQCLSRAHHLVTYDPAPDMRRLLYNPMGYMGAAAPDQDPVIDNDHSFSQYQSQHPGAMHRVTSLETGHANAAEHPASYQVMAAHILPMLGLRTMEQRRSTIYTQSHPSSAA